MKALPLCETGKWIGPPAGVDFVSQDRMMNGSHVDADLVSTAGLQDTFHVCEVLKALQNAHVRHGRLSGRRDGHFLPVFQVPADRPVDRELFFPDPVVDDGEILSSDAVFTELLRDGGVGSVVLADDE